MNDIFTFDDLIRYHYRETDLLEDLLIETALESDSLLRDKLEEIRYISKLLDASTISPSKASVNAIHTYSQQVDPVCWS